MYGANRMSNSEQKGNIIGRARIRSIIGIILIGVVLFAAAGDLAWWPAWTYLAILMVSMLLPLYGPLQFDEGLIEERMKPKPGAKRWDKYFVAFVGLFTMVELVVPGLDHRSGWTAPKPIPVKLAGVALVVLGTAGLIWAMRTNRFFSAVIRIQNDRGHAVVNQGPYRMVRHPGYSFWSVRTIGVPLLFGSDWAFIAAGLFIAMFVVRTALEDRVLQEELPGYREYAAQVRWRLIKGVW